MAVTANLWKVCKDEKTFSDPNTFKPDRFINDSGQFVRPDSKTLTPFGVGK